MSLQGETFTIEDDILKGPDYVFPEEWPSVGHFLFAKLGKNNLAYVNGQFDIEAEKKDTYQEIHDRSIRCAVGMRNNFVKKGDVVLMFSTNHIDVAIACFATQYLGAIFLPLDPWMPENELREVIKSTKPKLAFATHRQALNLVKIAKDLDLNMTTVSYAEIPDFPDVYNRFMAQVTEDDIYYFECEDIDSLDETAVVMYLTGRDGTSKTWAITHRTIFRELYTSKIFDSKAEKFISFTPIYTVQGLLYTFGSVFAKKTKYLTSTFDHNTACELIQKYRIEMVHLTDYACDMIVKFNAHRDFDLSSVKRIVCGGGLRPDDFHGKLTKAIPNVEILYGFGMVDIAGTVTMPCIGTKPGSCGRISENSQLKVVDLMTGEKLQKNQRGEIYVKSPSLMKRYRKGREATPEAVDEEGWLHTGDIGYYDEDGEVFIVGRVDELIAYEKGSYIYPRPIESFMMGQPGVKEVAVISVPQPIDHNNPEHIEHPVAFIVKMPNVEISKRELKRLVIAEIPEAQPLIYKGGIEYTEKLPRTPSEVVRRDLLRNHARKKKCEDYVKKNFPGLCRRDDDDDDDD